MSCVVILYKLSYTLRTLYMIRGLIIGLNVDYHVFKLENTFLCYIDVCYLLLVFGIFSLML
jgi:hypothetical protein